MHGAVLISALLLHTQCDLIYSIIWTVSSLTERDETVPRPLLASLFPANLWRDQVLVTSWCRPACCLDNVPEGHVHKLCSCHKEISGNKHELTFSLTSEFFILIFLQHGFFVCVCARLCILANTYSVVFVSSRVWRRKTSHCPSRIYLHFPARRHPITHHTSNTEGIT